VIIDTRRLTDAVVFLKIQLKSLVTCTVVGPGWIKSITHTVLCATISNWPGTFINVCTRTGTHTHTEHFTKGSD